MARPRYHVNAQDWLDTLDWLEHQFAQPQWLTQPDHPVHRLGLATLKDCLAQWRDVEYPSKDLCDSVQDILMTSFTVDDWGRLRKSLSARKRRRKESRRDEKTVNITLTPTAHQMLVEYRDLSTCATFSDAMEMALQNALAELKANQEKILEQELQALCLQMKASQLIDIVANYLNMADDRRSLANSCKIAVQLFHKRPDRNSLRLVRDRFIEDLVWNHTHLNVKYPSLGIF